MTIAKKVTGKCSSSDVAFRRSGDASENAVMMCAFPGVWVSIWPRFQVGTQHFGYGQCSRPFTAAEPLLFTLNNVLCRVRQGLPSPRAAATGHTEAGQ